MPNSPSGDALLRALERLVPHDHLCSIYDNPQDHFAVAVPFIRIGLARHEKCVYITDTPNLELVRDQLERGGIDVGAAIASGALVLTTKDETYMRQGSFDPEWMFTYWREAAAEALAQGFDALRATGETEWVVRGGPGLERWMEYECRLTHTLEDCRAFALCQYDRRVVPPEVILDVIRTHPAVIYQGTVCRNFYFVPPDEFLSTDAQGREVQRLLGNIRDREHLDVELRRAHDELEQRVLDRTRELQEREEWLTLAQQAAGIGIADWSLTDGSVRWSPEWTELYQLEPGWHLSPTAWFDRIHPEDRARVRREVSRAIELAGATHSEFRLALPDGALRWIALNVKGFSNTDGWTTRLLATSMDITARKTEEAARNTAQKLNSIGLLAGGIAHEFNNILTGVLGHASLVSRIAPPSMQRSIGAIIAGAERAADLTRQLLAYAGKGKYLVCDVDLAATTREMARLLRTTVPKNVELRLDVPAGLPLVRADASQIQQIIMNLVTNAAEAIGDARGGTIAIRTGVGIPEPTGSEPTPPDACVFLEVSDDGCGMDERTRAQIFDPFFSTKFTGRGLGLAAVAGIVRGHLGYVSVTSAPGQGCTFRVYLPIAVGANASADAQASSGQVPVARTVLVVDDEAPVRSFLQAALELGGYEVLLAATGEEALEVFQLRGDEIDLVLLDVVLPTLPGYEVLRELRRVRPWVRVLVMSGYDAAEAERLCGQDVAHDFIQKPYSAERLERAVRQALGVAA